MEKRTYHSAKSMTGNLRIGIVGPESTGKSELSRQLASHYGMPWVPEIARGFLEELKRPYREEDLLTIARLQLAAEQQHDDKGSGLLICDTTLLVIRIWSEFKYGRCHPELRRMEEERQYDFFLLTDIDIPWEPDPLREHPEQRHELFGWYYRALLEKNTPFHLISGLGRERTYKSIRIIDAAMEHLSEKNTRRGPIADKAS